MQHIDVDETALYNSCDYANEIHVKVILKNLNTFEQIKSNNKTAHCVLLDMKDAILHLKTRQKLCIEKYYIEGFDMVEIADELNIRKQTVQEHIKKAIKNIMIYLEPMQGDSNE